MDLSLSLPPPPPSCLLQAVCLHVFKELSVPSILHQSVEDHQLVTHFFRSSEILPEFSLPEPTGARVGRE